MNRRKLSNWLTAASLLLLAGVLPLACGGGGGDPVTPPGLNATWTPANVAPGVMTLNMGAGATSGASFSFPVQVTGIDDFFGAAFRVTFDPSNAAFSGYSAAGSVIDDGGATVLISAALGAPGEVLVNATRQQGAGGAYVPGVDVDATATLITLNFRATAATQQPNNFTFSNREVQTCNDGTETCDPVPDANLTWSGGSMQAR
jgi:hypothetical protein